MRGLAETAPLIVFRKTSEFCLPLPLSPTNVQHFSPKHISQLLVSVPRQLEILLFAWGGFLCIGSQGWKPANNQPLFLLADLQTPRGLFFVLLANWGYCLFLQIRLNWLKVYISALLIWVWGRIERAHNQIAHTRNQHPAHARKHRLSSTLIPTYYNLNININIDVMLSQVTHMIRAAEIAEAAKCKSTGCGYYPELQSALLSIACSPSKLQYITIMPHQHQHQHHQQNQNRSIWHCWSRPIGAI